MFLKNNVINRDGWRFNGDPCKLGVVTFDGYRIKPTKGENSCWYAVLVWSGRKPSPRFCATRDDLTSSTYYKRSVSSFLIFRLFVYDFIPKARSTIKVTVGSTSINFASITLATPN